MKNFFNRLMYGKSNKPDYTKEAIQSESKVKLFFDILGVQYGQLVKINLILIVCMLPTIFWTWLNFATTLELAYLERASYMVIYAVGLIPCLLILAAPLAGVTYIIKNFTQDKHVWLWKDFIEHTKSNAKQAILYMLIYSIVLCFGQLILYLYTVMTQTNSSMAILSGIFLVVYILTLLSALYAFPLMVTYELKLKHVIKNSLLLTIGSLKTTILAPLLTLLPFVLLLLLSTVWKFGLIFLALYFVFFGIAFGMYLTITFTTNVFAKVMNTTKEDDEELEQGNKDN